MTTNTRNPGTPLDLDWVDGRARQQERGGAARRVP